MKRLIAVVIATSVMAGCAAGPGGGYEMTPREQCEAVRAAVETTELGIMLADIKDAKKRAAILAAFEGVSSAANDYCDAARRGETPDALETSLRAYRVAIAEFRRQMRDINRGV